MMQGRLLRTLTCYSSNPAFRSLNGLLADRLFSSNDNAPLESYKKRAGKDLEHFKEKEEKRVGKDLEHIKKKAEASYLLPHHIWNREQVESVTNIHRKPAGKVDWAAYITVKCLRNGFDFLSGYTVKRWLGTFDEVEVCRRCIFLETVAGVPGFSAAMIRHLQSLRKMKRDNGWIHTLLEEAENERMHLLTFIQLYNPGPFMRAFVIITQCGFTGAFLLAYLISPKFCHRFVGYLEEEAVKTYTEVLKDIDSGKLPMWSHLPAPQIAVNYWKLADQAMMRDVILAVRADESNHRDVNHGLGDRNLKKDNPVTPGH